MQQQTADIQVLSKELILNILPKVEPDIFHLPSYLHNFISLYRFLLEKQVKFDLIICKIYRLSHIFDYNEAITKAKPG